MGLGGVIRSVWLSGAVSHTLSWFPEAAITDLASKITKYLEAGFEANAVWTTYSSSALNYRKRKKNSDKEMLLTVAPAAAISDVK